MTLFWLIEALAGLTENIAGFLLVRDVLDVREKKYGQAGFCSIVLTVGLLLLNQVHLFLAFATLYGLAGITLCVCILYKKKPGDTLVAVGSYFVLLHLLDFLLISLIGLLTENPGYGADITGQQSWRRVAYIVIAKTVLMISVYFVHRYAEKMNLLSRKMMAGILLAVELACSFVKKVCIQIDGSVIGTGILFFLTLVMGFYLMVQYAKLKVQRQQAELMEERSRVIADSCQSMHQSFYSSQLYYHDLKNHVIAMERYLLNHEYEKAAEYVASVHNSYQNVCVSVWTGVEILDFLLSAKKAEAEKQEICFSVDADAIVPGAVSEADLCAVMGNVLDNAIEGCERCEKERNIWVSVRKIHDMLMIKVKNTCVAAPERKDGHFATSKQDSRLHGRGLESVERIVNTYNGSVQYDCRDGMFSVALIFYF